MQLTVPPAITLSKSRFRLVVPVSVALALGALVACAPTKPILQPRAESNAGATSSLQEIIKDIDRGEFAAAEQSLAALAHTNVGADPGIAQQIEFERERMRRILLDFPYHREALKGKLAERIADVSEREIDAWTASGELESLLIDGERRYFKSVSNLFRLSAQARARTSPPTPIEADPPLYQVNPLHRLILDAAAAGSLRSQGRRFRIRYSLSVNADAVPPGSSLRTWIPFPRAIKGRQENITLVESEPMRARVGGEASLQRSVYLERAAEAGVPTEFSITYELTTFPIVHQISASQAALPDVGEVDSQYLTERLPHVHFTPALKAFSSRVLGDERNPYRVALALFDAVDAIPWAVAREYSTLSNISDHALHAGHADCGQKTLLLISLLRLNGIPARWQSGWQISPDGSDTMHDWGEFYLAPYGWMPMDVTHGRLGGGDPAVDTFYLGSIDGYRIIFNDDYSRAFDPPKQHMRSETVDAQRGEVEWSGGNLYFDQWDYRFEWQALPAETPAPPRSAR